MARVLIPDGYTGNPGQYAKETYAPEIAGAMANYSKVTYQASKLSLREFEAARARTAAINGCMICRNWRSGEDLGGFFAAYGGDISTSVAARGAKPDDAFYSAIEDWRGSDGFSERERIAMEYAEGLGLDPHGIADDEDFWRRAKAAFSDAELVDLSYCIACWIGAGRVAHALALDDVCAIGPAR